MFLSFPFFVSYALIDYLSIYAYITCIVHNLGALVI